MTSRKDCVIDKSCFVKALIISSPKGLLFFPGYDEFCFD